MMTIHKKFSAHQNVMADDGQEDDNEPKMGASLPRFQLLAAPLPGVEPGFVFAPRPWESNGEAGLRLCSAHICIWSPDSGQWTHNDRTRSGAGPEVESGLVVLEKNTDRTDPSFKHTNHLQTQLDTNRTGYSKILTSETRYFSYSSA